MVRNPAVSIKKIYIDKPKYEKSGHKTATGESLLLISTKEGGEV